MHKRLLIIFYKNPEPGKVKTRLAVKIGEESALKIYKHLSSEIIINAEKVVADRMLFYSRFIDKNDRFPDKLFIKKLQHGKTLGDRMHEAFDIGFRKGYQKICIIGTDIVDLSPAIIDDAFEKLSIRDFVIGPANDGGYYLLGMKQMNDKLFRNKHWGTDSVLGNTIDDIKSEKKSAYKLRELTDIDTYDDLKGFKKLLEIIKPGD